MKKTVLFALGAVFPLVALAVLTIIMPSLGTWVIVMGLAVIAGVFSAWAGQELGRLLLSVREGLDSGTQTTLKALGEANKETKAARSEANKILAERFERFFEEYGQRDEDWRTKTLAEWQAATQALDSSFEKMLSDVRSHLATLAEQERVLQEEATKSRAEVIDAELAEVRETFKQVEDTRNKLNEEIKKAIADLSKLVEAEAQRQQEQKRADRDHLEKMLEVQQKTHDEAAERSGQLWSHLLDQLKK